MIEDRQPVSPPSPYDDPTPCPECGTEDAEYGVHNDGCPSGYPTLSDTDRERDAMQNATWEFEEVWS